LSKSEIRQYSFGVWDRCGRKGIAMVDVFYPLELVEQIKVNNAQENKRLRNEKNDLLLKVGNSLYKM
jgi:hypothetical protein